MKLVFIKEPLFFKDSKFQFNEEFQKAFNKPKDIVKNELNKMVIIYPKNSQLIEDFFYTLFMEGMYNLNTVNQNNNDIFSFLISLDNTLIKVIPISLSRNHNDELEILIELFK